MSTKKEKESGPNPTPVELDPSSGPRAKSGHEDVGLLVASFRARAEGLDGAELEQELSRLLDRLVERNVKIVPEPLKEKARELLRTQLLEDPTLKALIQDLRDSVRR